MFGHPPELELEELPDPDDGVVVEPELEDGVVVVAMLAEPEPEPELEPEPVAACVIAAAPPAIVPVTAIVAMIFRSGTFMAFCLLSDVGYRQ
ncbi:MAG TPA: hypothetical protein VFA24_06765 [Gaiellaceae bacterium]|nr:hypothetical protein [Gaiellaceae bacterium]